MRLGLLILVATILGAVALQSAEAWWPSNTDHYRLWPGTEAYDMDLLDRG